MRTFRFTYFCKCVGTNTLQCIRLPTTDERLYEYSKLYNRIGFETSARFPYVPSEKEEKFHIQMRFRAWDREVIITDADKEPLA